MLIKMLVVVLFCMNSCANCQNNVALGKLVRESSASNPYNGYLVVDNVSNFPFCFSSLTSGYQWIQVDLIWFYRISFVQVLNKLPSNIFNVQLTKENFLMVASCSNLSSQLNNVNVTFQCPNATEDSSKYITIHQSNTSKVNMKICEVVVDGIFNDVGPERTNLLLNKNALMNSVYSYASSLTNAITPMVGTLVVDGIRDPTFSHCHCAHCYDRGFAQNWMQVDMGRDYRIGYIALVGRDVIGPADALRLANFIIGLTSKRADKVTPIRGGYPLCATYPGEVLPATRVTLHCNANLPAYRYIFLHQAIGAGDGYISACELEAYEPAVVFPDKRIKWTPLKNRQLMNYTFMEVTALRPLHCVEQCIRLGEFSCDSFNFNKQLNICQMNKHRNGFQNGSLVANISWTFWTARYEFLGNL